MTKMAELLFETMALWSIETTLLVLLALFFCRRLKNQPGGIHAAIWTATLILIWSLPIAPRAIPSAFHFRLLKPEIIQVNVGRTPPPASRTSSPLQRPFAGTDNNRIEKPSVLPPSSDRPSTLNGRNQEEETLAASSKFSWRWSIDLVLGLWMVGVGCSVRHWMKAEKNVHRLISRSSEIEDRAIRSSVERTRQILFIHESIHLRTAEAQTAPFVLGLFRPTIFIPNYMIQEWPQRDHQAVIAHELAHVRRYDLISHHAMRLLRIVFWFLPPVGWMQRELHHAQDAACDECAAVVLGSGAEFGRALTQLAEYCLITDPAFPALGILHSKPSLIARLENIMNAQLNTLSRLSLKWKVSLLSLACALFLLAGMVKPALSQQSLTVDFLGNFSGARNSTDIQSILYAPPYYALVGIQNGQQVIHYYEYDNGNLAFRFTVRLNGSVGGDPQTTARLAVANDRFTVVFYSTSKGILLTTCDHKIAQSLKHMIYPANMDSIRTARLDGADLYFLDQMQNGTLYRYDLTQESPQTTQWTASIPEHISVNDLDLLNGEILLSDGFGTDEEGVDPAIGSKTGVARAWVNADNQLEIGLNRWFATDRHPFIDRILTKGTTAFITRDADRSFAFDLLVVDWSVKDSPQIIQTLEIGSETAYEQVNDSLLAVPTCNTKIEEMAGTDLYQQKAGLWEKVSNLPKAIGRIALGPEVLLSYGSNTLSAFDIVNPAAPRDLNLSFDESFLATQIALADMYLYAIHQEKNQTYFTTLDTAIPGSTQIVRQQPLANSSNTLQAHDSWLSLTQYNPDNLVDENQISLYAIQDDGSLGASIAHPPFPADIQYTSVGAPLYNNHLYIQRFYIPQPDGKTTQDPAYPELYIYTRDGNSIGSQPVSRVSLTTNSGYLTLSDSNLFYEIRQEYKSETTEGVYSPHTDTTLYTYSLENPARPIQLSQFIIPPSSGNISVFGLSPQSVAARNAYFAYASTKQSGVVDLSNPQNPKNLASLPPAMAVFWYDDLLGLAGNNLVIFYRIDREQGPVEIARMNQRLPRSVSISKNRMAVCRLDQGVDIYQLNLDPTGVLNWKLY